MTAAPDLKPKGMSKAPHVQPSEVDAALLDHQRQLLCGQDNIHVPVAVHSEFRPAGLKLLGGTGHYGDDDQVLPGNAQVSRQLVLA